MIFGLICAALVIGADQLTKFLIYGLPEKSILGDLLWIDSRFNTGVAFSMLENLDGADYIFIVTALLASAVFVWLICSKKFLKHKFSKVSIGLILGGTVGNVIDRIAFGGVRDFLYFKFINFPVFNIADVAIVIGVILICVYILFFGFKSKKSEENQSKE